MSTIEAPGVLIATEGVPEIAAPEPGITPAQEAIQASLNRAAARDNRKVGDKRIPRTTRAQIKSSDIAAARANLSSDEEVLLALDEAVIRQAELEAKLAEDFKPHGSVDEYAQDAHDRANAFPTQHDDYAVSFEA